MWRSRTTELWIQVYDIQRRTCAGTPQYTYAVEAGRQVSLASGREIRRRLYGQAMWQQTYWFLILLLRTLKKLGDGTRSSPCHKRSHLFHAIWTKTRLFSRLAAIDSSLYPATRIRRRAAVRAVAQSNEMLAAEGSCFLRQALSVGAITSHGGRATVLTCQCSVVTYAANWNWFAVLTVGAIGENKFLSSSSCVLSYATGRVR